MKVASLPHVDAQLEAAVKRLVDYLDSSASKPLTNLILGPPGAGKSHVARKLHSEISTRVKCEFLELNFADVADYQGVSAMWQRIISLISQGHMPFVLVDECDVTLHGSSLLRFLINPMYGGSFLDRNGTPFAIKKCVFIFCGSHLRSRSILRQIQGGVCEVDIVALYFDLMMHYRRLGLASLSHQKQIMFQTLSQAKPFAAYGGEAGSLGYLLRLEKLQDFLSRVNGFVIELPDLSKPLELCAGIRYHLCDASFTADKPPTVAELRLSDTTEFENIKDFWTLHDHYGSHAKPYMPLLAYKRALVAERLSRARKFIADYRYNDQDIKPADVAYLGTAWLRHGMRSLETIVGHMIRFYSTHGSSGQFEPARDVLQAHIVEGYGGPQQLYQLLCDYNGGSVGLHPILNIHD